MSLTSKFGTVRVAQSTHTPLTDAQLMLAAPSIFTEEPHASRSERYRPISTIDVLEGLRREGFQPFYACQQRVRRADKLNYAKHMLRLRHIDYLDEAETNEIILLNSHDGTSSYQLIAGQFRFVCCNGMVLGSTEIDQRIRHKGNNIVNDVIEGAYTVVENFDRITNQRESMKQIILPTSAQHALATAALEYRYGSPDQDDDTADKRYGGQNFPVRPDQILMPRRIEDNKPDLWSTFNRLQENMMKGGLQGRQANGRRRRTRAVTGIDTDIKLNRALWTLAESMKEMLS